MFFSTFIVLTYEVSKKARKLLYLLLDSTSTRLRNFQINMIVIQDVLKATKHFLSVNNVAQPFLYLYAFDFEIFEIKKNRF